jgi:hypothetical protein
MIGDLEDRSPGAQPVPRLQVGQQAKNRIAATIAVNVGPRETLAPLKGLASRPP